MQPESDSMPTADPHLWPTNGFHAETYVPPSAEHRFWLRLLKDFIAPRDGRGSLFSRVWGVLAVAPFAHITFFNLDYQAYLYDVFHQTKTSRIGHQACMPLNVFMWIVALTQLTFGAHPAANGTVLFSWSWGLVLAAVLTAWYVALAVNEGYYAWGAVMATLMAGMYTGATAYYHAFFIADAALRTWYAPTPLVYNPFLWMGVCSLMQALSHVPEPRIPPRVTASPYWKSIPEFIFGLPGRRNPPGRVAVNALRTFMQGIYGTIAEWWAAPRLFNIGILEQMWRHGYQRERFAAQDALVQRAIASGNPAVDYIGEGGGAYLRY